MLHYTIYLCIESERVGSGRGVDELNKRINEGCYEEQDGVGLFGCLERALARVDGTRCVVLPK